MTDTERQLLDWCATMLLRSAPLRPDEADTIDGLLAGFRANNSLLESGSHLASRS
jgi:hypothetical protein